AAGAAAAAELPFAAPAAVLTPPPPGVAAEGQRLRRAVPWAGFIVVGFFVLIWLAANAGLFSRFFSFLN
ncbi:MAG: hypothetical protein QM611_10610, partial [Microbacterium sp.]